MPHLSNSCEFKMVRLVFEDECFTGLGVWGSSLQVYHVGSHGWLLFFRVVVSCPPLSLDLSNIVA